MREADGPPNCHSYVIAFIREIPESVSILALSKEDLIELGLEECDASGAQFAFKLEVGIPYFYHSAVVVGFDNNNQPILRHRSGTGAEITDISWESFQPSGQDRSICFYKRKD